MVSVAGFSDRTFSTVVPIGFAGASGHNFNVNVPGNNSPLKSNNRKLTFPTGTRPSVVDFVELEEEEEEEEEEEGVEEEVIVVVEEEEEEEAFGMGRAELNLACDVFEREAN